MVSQKKTQPKGVRTWIEIDKSALEKNFKLFKSILGETKLCSVVKSNAYGQGLVGYSKIMESFGVDMLAVDSLVEGLRLRREGLEVPILVLGYTLPDIIEKAVSNNITLTVSNFNFLDEIPDDLSGKLKVHVKADTGMRRQGFLKEDMGEVIRILKLKNKVKVEGLYTHLAGAGNKDLDDETGRQIEEFREWTEEFKKVFGNVTVHSAASSAVFSNKEALFDMVRVGIGLNGYWASPEMKEDYGREFELSPSLAWKTIISEIKSVKKGQRIGYDLTESFQKDTQVAVCPIGYWHGFDRRLSSRGYVLVKGKRSKVMGLVSMDMISIDVGGLGSKVGDEVVLIGKQGSGEVSVDEIANMCGTINHEILTRINPLIKKVYR